MNRSAHVAQPGPRSGSPRRQPDLAPLPSAGPLATPDARAFQHDFSLLPTGLGAARTAASVSTAAGALQRKLSVGRTDDPLEHEADRVADAVLRMPQPRPAAMSSVSALSGARLQSKCASCGEQDDREEAPPIRRRAAAPDHGRTAAPAIVEETLRAGGGRPLDAATRNYFEPRFGHDFSAVRVHASGRAGESARAVNSLAYTVGRDIVFRDGSFAPQADSGRRLLAHELSHVVQQSGGSGRPAQPSVQRKLGDKHDLASPRFSKLLDLEDVFDGTRTLKKNDKGRGVQALQQALYDIGFSEAAFGADGGFGSETETAVKAFQAGQGIKAAVPGQVEAKTMEALDKRFAAVALPAAAVRSATWNQPCVRKILCPWSPHTVEVLKARITLKSFDSISWDDEEWDGKAWKITKFPGGGFNTGTEIGVLNSSCESMAETLYHEVLHAEQPTTHDTTLKKESYAYRIGEEFSIGMGLSGRPALRDKDAQGRQFADPTKVDAFVSSVYPAVAAGGKGEEILDKGGAAGSVKVQKPDKTKYERPAKVGEKVPGPMTVVKEKVEDATKWTCP